MGATASSLPAVLPNAQTLHGEAVLAAPPLLFAGLLAGVRLAALFGSASLAPKVVAVGAALQCAALVLAAVSWSSASFVVASAFAGLGFGLTESAVGAVVKAVTGEPAPGTLTALTTTVAVVAAVAPLSVWVVTSVTPPSSMALLAPAALNLAGAAAIASLDIPRTPTTAPLSPRRLPPPLLWLAGGIALYVGVESVVAGWSSVIPFQLLAVDSSSAALGTSAFWVLMAAGRAGASLALRGGASARLVLLTSALLAAAALTLAAGSASSLPALALVALAAATVAFAPTYGLILGTALDRVDVAAAPRVSSAIVASGACGGAALPFVMLMMGSRPGDPGTFLVCAAASASVAALIFAGFSSVPSHRRRPRHG